MSYNPARFSAMAPCAPRQAMPQCFRCARHNQSIPSDPTRRPHTVLIDGSAVTRGGVCPMREVIQ